MHARSDADQALIKRVFSNLIQNALTHSARAVTVTLGARTDSGGTLFTVADDGVGIPPEYHDLIFRKFEQVKTPHIPRVRSSGSVWRSASSSSRRTVGASG
jgi:signal transduction histidine kinase